MAKKDISAATAYKLPVDWRGKVMSQLRQLINQADPEVVEEVKWKKPSNPDGNLVWYHTGMICTGEIYTKHLRLTFAKGAFLKDHDSKGLINTFRSMVIHETDQIDESAFVDLIRAAVELNIKSKPSVNTKKK